MLLISINEGTLSAQSVKDDLGQQVKNKIVNQANKSMAKYHVPGVSIAVIRNGKDRLIAIPYDFTKKAWVSESQKVLDSKINLVEQ